MGLLDRLSPTPARSSTVISIDGRDITSYMPRDGFALQDDHNGVEVSIAVLLDEDSQWLIDALQHHSVHQLGYAMGDNPGTEWSLKVTHAGIRVSANEHPRLIARLAGDPTSETVQAAPR